MAATLIDQMSTLALASNFIRRENDKWPKSLTVTLNISFLNPARLDDTILINCLTLKKGKTLAHLDVNITNKLDGKLIAQGKHIKFMFYE